MRGLLVPHSHRVTVISCTPSLAATSPCVASHLSRSARTSLAVAFSFIVVMIGTR